MTSPTLALAILCHCRPRELADALTSAVGFDEVIVADMASDPPLQPVMGIHWLRSDENLGVTGGRNLLAARANADVLVFLDDDAVFRTPDAADRIRDLMKGPDAPQVVAFRIVRADGMTVSAEHPFRGSVRDVDHARPCAYFLGGAVAVERAAFLDAGGFDERFRYSTEEIDLAYTIMRQGGTVRYEPSIVVEHRPSDRGRGFNPHVPALRLQNRLLMVRKHLPWAVGVVHAGAWAARTFREAVRAHGIGPWLRAWNMGLRLPVERRPLTFSALRRIHRDGGRVWW